MLTQYQRSQLEALFRRAVLLAVNPAGTGAPCEFCRRRLGRDAHHAVRRSQEPSLRIKYEPRFGVLLCMECHAGAHQRPNLFQLRLLEVLSKTNPAKARCLARYSENHDRVRARDVDWRWMVAYLKRCISRRERFWSQTYCSDVPAGIYNDL